MATIAAYLESAKTIIRGRYLQTKRDWLHSLAEYVQLKDVWICEYKPIPSHTHKESPIPHELLTLLLLPALFGTVSCIVEGFSTGASEAREILEETGVIL